ncbi:MAG TPA: S9 family peptidase, partial [Candidatus Limnocylindria bacterium]|nr:S9 family peptidase [Candidatus Limnocylindria bacterium]
GGPHSQKVANTWELTVQPWRQLMTELGAAVLVVDNRGTAHRGMAFERPLHCRLGEVEVEDQLAAIDQLAARGLIDADRVAITGGSYGGFMTIRAMLRHPERFTAGVAWAPVVDWEGYDTAYTERYLGLPEANHDGYRSSSLRPEAGRLRGALLIQHGLVDENVHFRHTARLLEAFDAAGVSCDLQVFPGERHSGRHAPALRARYRREVGHLARGLGLTLPDGWS